MADTPQSGFADEINVKVKTMQPATYELKIPLTATVGNLKQLLVDKASIPQDRQRIIYKGRVLDNDQQLQAHGVQEGHTLHLVERAPTAPSPAAGQTPQLPGQGQIPIAVGSLELDTEETDVNALLSSIFTQFGGQGGMPGFAAGEGEHAAGGNVDHQGGQEAQFIAQQLMSTLQGQAGQDFGMQAFGGMPGERRPNMLASIQTYLDKLQEIMQNPSVMLPSLSYPPGQEHELREQRQLLEAVRGILTPAVRSALSPEQQAFLNAEASWQPPAPATASTPRHNSATQRQSGAVQAAAHVQQNESAAQQATSNVAADQTQQQAAEVNTTAGTAAASGNGTAAMVVPTTNDDSSEVPAASSTAQDSLAQAQPFGSPVQPQSEPAQHETSASAVMASPAAAREAAATFRQAASQAQEPCASPARGSASTARQAASAARQSTSAARESASAGRSEDSSRRRRRRAAISPVVTMALGSLLQTTLEGDAFQDPANVLSNAAQLLLSSHSFEGDNRAQVLANLRSAGSHLYRLAPLLMELARACSAAVAAMQGDAGPLALSSAHYIRPDGSRPAIGYTPASGQQFMTSNMSIPLFPGMPPGAMHLGPDGVRPTMAGPAPAANGPASAAGSRGGVTSSAGPGAASGAGAGADANRAGQAIGLNIGTLLQSAFAGGGGGGGGLPNRPGVSMGEARQVIQVPGAPPVSIRFGSRPPGSHPPPPGQQSPVNSPVSLQVGNGTPVDLSPIVQRLGTMLGSAIQSAVSTASPSGLASAAASTATAAASAAGPSGNRQPGQPAGNASGANAATADTLLNPPVMQHLARALMHSLSPFISQAAAGAASGSNQAGTASAPSSNTAPASGSAGTTVPAATGASSSGGGSSRPQLGLSDSLDAMIGMNPSADAFVSQMPAQGLIDALTQAGASSVNIQGPIAAHGTAHSTPAQATAQAADVTSAAAPALEALSTQQLPVGEPVAGPAASLPSSQALPDPASASAAGPASGVTRPGGQRAVGLGSAALPPRDKGSKKSHSTNPRPVSTALSADQTTSGRQSPGSRPAPSQPQQDNVKRARRGSSPSSEGLSHSPAPTVGGLPSGAEPGAAGSRGEAVEEIAQPNRAAVQASSAGGLDALMAGMFGGGSGSGGGGGLNINSLMQVAGQMMSDPEVSRGVTGMIETIGQRAGGTRADQSEQSSAGAGVADAGGGFGAIMQSLGPMMQQLAVEAGQSQGTGTQQVAGSANGVSSSNWQEALRELDEGEKAEWECIIREDLEKQADLAPERYKDHSTAYLAGTPPSAASTLLPGRSAGSHDEDSD